MADRYNVSTGKAKRLLARAADAEPWVRQMFEAAESREPAE